MFNYLDGLSKNIYGFFSGSSDNLAKWYDLAYLLIPICGVVGFVLSVEGREE